MLREDIHVHCMRRLVMYCYDVTFLIIINLTQYIYVVLYNNSVQLVELLAPQINIIDSDIIIDNIVLIRWLVTVTNFKRF